MGKSRRGGPRDDERVRQLTPARPLTARCLVARRRRPLRRRNLPGCGTWPRLDNTATGHGTRSGVLFGRQSPARPSALAENMDLTPSNPAKADYSPVASRSAKTRSCVGTYRHPAPNTTQISRGALAPGSCGNRGLTRIIHQSLLIHQSLRARQSAFMHGDLPPSSPNTTQISRGALAMRFLRQPGASAPRPWNNPGKVLSRGVNGYFATPEPELYGPGRARLRPRRCVARVGGSAGASPSRNTKPDLARSAVTVHGPLSGPFFGRSTRPRGYALAENMDLTRWNQGKSFTGL